MADGSFIDTLVKLGVDPVTDSTPAMASSMIAAELGKWRPIIQALQLGSDAPVRSASPRR